MKWLIVALVVIVFVAATVATFLDPWENNDE